MIFDRVTTELRIIPLLVASVILNTPNGYGRLFENRLYVAIALSQLLHTKPASSLVYVVQLMVTLS